MSGEHRDALIDACTEHAIAASNNRRHHRPRLCVIETDPAVTAAGFG
ncbi:hypothetical protein K8O92_24830 [Nocardia asteroides]|nr:hypothetical protein K8O92_24830 [Nocardia asteroides]